MRPLVRVVKDFVGIEERRQALDEIAAHSEQLRRVGSPAGIGPRYAVLGGDVISSHLPSVVKIGARVQTAVEEYASAPLEPFHDPVRRARVQLYTEREDGFRWHFDGHRYVALVTLENESGGVTELIAPRLSTAVRPLFYAAYALPQLFSALPRTPITAEAGDAVIFSGSQSLHRGRSLVAGRRTVLVFAFDVVGTRRSALRNFIARRLNY